MSQTPGVEDSRPSDLLQARCIEQQALDAQFRWASEALQQSRAELFALFDQAPLPLLLLARQEFRVVRVNRAGADVLGGNPDELIGRRMGEAIGCVHALSKADTCGDGAACSDCASRTTVSDTFSTGRRHYQVEVPIERRNEAANRPAKLLISTSQISVFDDPMVLLCVEDVSRGGASQRDRRQFQKMAAVGKLASCLADDLSDALTVIVGYAQMTLSHVSDDALVQRHVQEMLNAAARASVLVGQLRCFESQSAAEAQELGRRPAVPPGRPRRAGRSSK